MDQIEYIIQEQRSLLLQNGYTRHFLHVEYEPALFLSTLKTALNQIREGQGKIEGRAEVKGRLKAEFENGRFSTDLIFNYESKGDKLVLQKVDVSVFDLGFSISIKGDHSNLWPAADLLKEIKSNLLIDIQRKAYKQKHSTSGLRKRSR